MKVMLLHNSYQKFGGEDAVVAAEGKLLEAGNHELITEIVTNNNINDLISKMDAFRFITNNPHKREWVIRNLRKHQIDLLHIHNFFPLLTPSVHEGASLLGVPVVQTLHNYRLLCANALLLRNGNVCEKCIGGNNLWAVAHKCYRKSYIASLAVSRMIHKSHKRGVWNKAVSRYIALTEFSKNKFAEGGIPAERIAVKPNFVSDPGPMPDYDLRSGILFVGRLSNEKGVKHLLDAWRNIETNEILTIIGDGPLLGEFSKQSHSRVRFVGAQSKQYVMKSMRNAKLLVMPSIWYEGFPMTLLEAYSSGLPVAASDIGSLTELVKHRNTGALFKPGNSIELSKCLNSLIENNSLLKIMSNNAREEYLKKYTPEKNLVQLERIYIEAESQRLKDNGEKK